MTDANLFQLGIGLETGAHAEDNRSLSAANETRDVLDDARDDHFIRRDGRVFAGTHLIIEVVDGTFAGGDEYLAQVRSSQPGEYNIAHLSGVFDYARYVNFGLTVKLNLDNIPNIQASWVTQGAKIAQVALAFGANDLGSTMIEENVVAAAGVSFRLPRSEMVRLIQTAGYRAVQRDCFYHHLKVEA